MKVKSLSPVRLFETPWTLALQAPLSMEFSRQILQCVAIPFSRGSSQRRDQTQVSCIGRLFLHHPSHRGRRVIDLKWAYISYVTFLSVTFVVFQIHVQKRHHSSPLAVGVPCTLSRLNSHKYPSWSSVPTLQFLLKF